MTQLEFGIIVKVLEKGVPALADELVGAMTDFVSSYNKLVAENTELKAKLAATSETPVETTEEEVVAEAEVVE